MKNARASSFSNSVVKKTQGRYSVVCVYASLSSTASRETEKYGKWMQRRSMLGVVVRSPVGPLMLIKATAATPQAREGTTHPQYAIGCICHFSLPVYTVIDSRCSLLWSCDGFPHCFRTGDFIPPHCAREELGGRALLRKDVEHRVVGSSHTGSRPDGAV